MIANGLAQHLDSQGVATLGTDLFTRQMPDMPNNAICLYNEPGTTLQEAHTYDEDSFGVKVMVRGSDSFASSKILDIHRQLTNLTGTFDSIELRQTTIQTSPAFAYNDEDGRAVYTAHYEHHCKIGGNVNRKP